MFSIATRHLYLCVGIRSDIREFLPAVLRGGVDIVQLREKQAPDEEQIRVGTLMREICHEFGVPFIMNDSAELALATQADGVHVGQDDESVAHCRALLGDEAIIGISTHADEEFDAALSLPVTYRSAGPIVATPTKAGRTPTGIEYPVRCVNKSSDPVFVTGGVDVATLPGLVAAGLRHFVVVRALSESSTPEATARALNEAMAPLA